MLEFATETLYRQQHAADTLGAACMLPPDAGALAHMCGPEEVSMLTTLGQAEAGKTCGLDDIVNAWTHGDIQGSQEQQFCDCVVKIGFDGFKDIGCRLNEGQSEPIATLAGQCVPDRPCSWYLPTYDYWADVDGKTMFQGGDVSENLYDAGMGYSGVSDDGCDHQLSLMEDGLQLHTCDADFCPECTGGDAGLCDATCHFCKVALTLAASHLRATA